MELYTLDRNFQKIDVIDEFHSLIWTERYYGDSEVELVVPETPEMISKLPLGTFLSLVGSDEIMILETEDFDDDKIKFRGISLLPWMNNRFVRTSPNHEDKYWYISGGTAGWTLQHILYNMCCEGSPYLNGTIDIGLINSEQFAIPNLTVMGYDNSGEPIKIGVPYGPVYNALREIATTYEIGMQIVLNRTSPSSYQLGFRNYKGLDRTSRQFQNSVVRFSAELDTFANIKEVQSIALLKTLMYTFAPNNPDGLAYQPGVSFLTDPARVGFDLRAGLNFADDITTDMVSGDAQKLIDILNSRSKDALIANRWFAAIDGEIVPDNQYKYKEDYNLGDLVEVQGKTRILQVARITEFIRVQDPAGERSYPTMTMLNSESDIIDPGPVGPLPVELPVADMMVMKSTDAVQSIVGYTGDYEGDINLSPFVGELPGDYGLYSLMPYESLAFPNTVLVHAEWSEHSPDLRVYRRVYRVNRDGTEPTQLIQISREDDISPEMQESYYAMDWYEDTDGSIKYYDWIDGTDGFKNLVARNSEGDETILLSFADLPFVWQSTMAYGEIKINNNRTRLWIHLNGSNAGYGYYVVNLETGVTLNTTLGYYSPIHVYGNYSWSPNNVDVVFDVMTTSPIPDKIMKINVDTGDISTVYYNDLETDRCSAPFYSKHGDFVAFTRFPVGSDEGYLSVFPASGSGTLETLTSVPVSISTGDYGREQSFSPDDANILFTMWDSASTAGHGAKIWNRFNDTVFDLTDDFAIPVIWLGTPYVAPPPSASEGPMIIVADVDMYFPESDEVRNFKQLLIVELDGTERWLKTSYRYSYHSPVWNHDYTKIAYFRYEEYQEDGVTYGSGQYDLMIIDPDGTNEQLIRADVYDDTRDGQSHGAMQFSFDGQKIAVTHPDNRYWVINIDGTGLVYSDPDTFTRYHYVPVWSPLGWLVSARQVFVGVEKTEFDIRRWNPVTDEVEIIWDIKAYADTHGYDLDWPNRFGLYDTLDCNADNILVFGIENNEDVPTGSAYMGDVTVQSSNETLCFLEAVPGATPTFINAEDMPDYDWEIYMKEGTFTPPNLITPTSPASQPVLDNFNRSDETLTTPWVTTGVTLVGNEIPSQSVNYARYAAIGPFANADVSMKLPSEAAYHFYNAFYLGVKVQTDYDGLYLEIKKTSTPNLYGVGLMRRLGGVSTPFYFSGNRNFYPGDTIRFRQIGNTCYWYRNATLLSSYGLGGFAGDTIPWANGYIGFITGLSGSMDDFGGGEVTVTTYSPEDYSWKEYPIPDQIWWSPDGQHIMWHNEVPVPEDYVFFREWQSLVMKPDGSDFWTFQFAPNGSSGDRIDFEDYGIEDTLPSYADEYYVPTWLSNNKIAANGDDNIENTYEDEDYIRGAPGNNDGGWAVVAQKGKDETPEWLARNYIATYYWDYYADYGPSVKELTVTDNFNRGSLGGDWTVTSGSIDIVSNKLKGTGRAYYGAGTWSRYTLACATIGEVAAIEYRLVAIDPDVVGLPAIGFYWNGDTGEFGKYERDVDGIETRTPDVISPISMNTGDKIGIRLEEGTASGYIKDGSNEWIASYYQVYTYPAIPLPWNRPLRMAIEMDGPDGSIDDFSILPGYPEPLIWTRYAPTGGAVQTWSLDQNHGF